MNNNIKKKILLFTSKGGGGHEAVAKSLISYLEDNYTVIPNQIFTQTLKPLDLVQKFTFGFYTTEQLYNFLIRHQQNRLINFIYRQAKAYFKQRELTVQHLVQQTIQKEQPHLVISIVPIINNAILQACKTYQLPFILIPADMDASSFVFSMHSPTYPHLYVLLSLNESLKTIKKAHIPADHIYITGLVLRPSFFEPKDIAVIKQEFNIRQDKPVILVLMGAQGSHALISFAKKLTTVPIPIHIIFAIGTYEKARKKIKALAFPSYISTSIISFTPHIADLMASADLIITKPGSLSTFESICSGTPVLLDATTTPLMWENFNIDFIKQHNYGDSLTSLDQLVPKVTQLLEQPQEYQAIKEAIKKRPIGNAAITIQELIKTILKDQ